VTEQAKETGMTRLILQMGISIDGFVAALDGSQPSLGEAEDDAAKQWKLDTVRGADAHVMGRVTYLDMAAHWPGSESAYAAPMNDIPKVVFSKTLQSAA
jgi:dihydrofolate reductase